MLLGHLSSQIAGGCKTIMSKLSYCTGICMHVSASDMNFRAF